MNPQPPERSLAMRINAPGVPHIAVIVSRDDLARVLAGERVDLPLQVA